MKPLEVHLVALDVLEAALMASTIDEVVCAAKPDLEVLSREDLIRVAMAVGVEAVQATPCSHRPPLRQRVQGRRLIVMMDGS